MTRLDLLKTYLAQLAADTAATGKFAGAGSDRAQAAARALLSGAAGMLEALFEDVKVVAGDGRAAATGAVAGFASRAIEGAVRTGIDKLVEAVTASLDKDKRARRSAGRAVTDAAKRMGRR